MISAFKKTFPEPVINIFSYIFSAYLLFYFSLLDYSISEINFYVWCGVEVEVYLIEIHNLFKVIY